MTYNIRTPHTPNPEWLKHFPPLHSRTLVADINPIMDAVAQQGPDYITNAQLPARQAQLQDLRQRGVRYSHFSPQYNPLIQDLVGRLEPYATASGDIAAHAGVLVGEVCKAAVGDAACTVAARTVGALALGIVRPLAEALHDKDVARAAEAQQTETPKMERGFASGLRASVWFRRITERDAAYGRAHPAYVTGSLVDVHGIAAPTAWGITSAKIAWPEKRLALSLSAQMRPDGTLSTRVQAPPTPGYYYIGQAPAESTPDQPSPPSYINNAPGAGPYESTAPLEAVEFTLRQLINGVPDNIREAASWAYDHSLPSPSTAA